MPLEREAELEQRLGVELASRNERACNETERDRRRARSQAALPRDSLGERERVPVERSEPRERLDREVVLIGCVASVADLELVPEVERRRGAVEPGADVGGRRRSAHADRHSTASGSLSP